MQFFRNPEIMNECDIDEDTREKLLADIKRRLTPQAVKIRSGISGDDFYSIQPVRARADVETVMIMIT